MGEGSSVVRKLPSGFREKFRHKANTRGKKRGPSKASRLQRLLVMLDSEPLEEILAQPNLGTGQPEVRQVVAHLLDEFHFLV